MSRALLVAVFVGVAAPASATITLRFATVIPDGTAWAHELRGFASEVQQETGGEVAVKWYFGGIAGDDLQVRTRIERDQLDGAGSGMLCERLSPSMRGLRVPGLFRGREEVRHVAGRLRPTFEEEFAKQGFAYLGHAVLGGIMVASRQPVRSLDELKRTRFWSWDFDDVTRQVLDEMKLALKSAPVEAAAGLYADRQVDGFLAMPAAMLAFQWSAQARYVTDVKVNYFMSCLFVSQRAMSRLAMAHRNVLAAATAKLSGRLETVGEEQDAKLMGGLFGRQGLVAVPASESFQRAFLDEASAAVKRLGDRLIPVPLLERLNELVAEYRAAHPTQARR